MKLTDRLVDLADRVSAKATAAAVTLSEREPVRRGLAVAGAGIALELVIDLLDGSPVRTALRGAAIAAGALLYGGRVARSKAWSPATAAANRERWVDEGRVAAQLEASLPATVEYSPDPDPRDDPRSGKA